MKKISFLLVDDDLDDREIFEKKLQELSPGAKLKMVNDGKEAINYLSRCGNEQLPSVIIIDYNMPNMNGPQVLDWLCNRSWYDGITKFVWSTADDKEYIDGCKNKGALEYFVKPANESDLDKIVKKLIDYCLHKM